MFTRAYIDGHEYQFKTGYDNLQSVEVGDTLDCGSSRADAHVDGVHCATPSSRGMPKAYWVVVKDRKVVEIVPRDDVDLTTADGCHTAYFDDTITHQQRALMNKYGISEEPEPSPLTGIELAELDYQRRLAEQPPKPPKRGASRNARLSYKRRVTAYHKRREGLKSPGEFIRAKLRESSFLDTLLPTMVTLVVKDRVYKVEKSSWEKSRTVVESLQDIPDGNYKERRRVRRENERLVKSQAQTINEHKQLYLAVSLRLLRMGREELITMHSEIHA